MKINKRQFIFFTAFISLFQKIMAKEIPHQIWDQLKNLKGIPMQPGMSQTTLYVFIDLNCTVCADLWKKQVNGKPFHELPAIWIPVAHMGNNSLGKAAELLRSGSKEDLHLNFTKFNRGKRQGGLQGVIPTPMERSALAAAKSLWLELGGATPMFIYRSTQGEARLFLGLPPEPHFTELVASMLFPSTAP